MSQLTYADLVLPNYLNTRQFFANLHVADGAIAAVLANLGLLLVGDTGTGKSQLLCDVKNHYFKGNKADGGHSIFIRAHPEVDIYNEIFTTLNLERAERQLTTNIDALLYAVDELNRGPLISQNQFFPLGDGVMDYRGRAIALGRDGYHVLIATANLGNGEFGGTFKTDKAMYNRLHVAFDFDYEQFKPTEQDEMELDLRKVIDPNVKEAKPRDISEKILGAAREIGRMAADPGTEALAVINYLRFGLRNCQLSGRKEKTWPLHCQDCEHNTQKEAKKGKSGKKSQDAGDSEDKSLCSLVRAPVRRTVEATIKYAAALQFLAKLKDPKVNVDQVDLVFKAFEMTGAYQLLLNPQVLKMEYQEQNPKMMADAVEKLKENYRQNEDFILCSLQSIKEGIKTTRFFQNGKKGNGKLGDYDLLNDEAKAKANPVEPYTDAQEIGFKWMIPFLDYQEQLAKKKK